MRRELATQRIEDAFGAIDRGNDVGADAVMLELFSRGRTDSGDLRVAEGARVFACIFEAAEEALDAIGAREDESLIIAELFDSYVNGLVTVGRVGECDGGHFADVGTEIFERRREL